MAWWKTVLFVFLLFSILGVSSAAQERFGQHEFEVTPFGGTRFGGVIDVNTSSWTT